MFKKLTISIVLATLCLYFGAAAQDQPSPVLPVKMGARVPDALWDTPMRVYQNGKYSTQTLRRYKGKVIVFDFWATWCGNCIEAFPKMRQLQDSLGEGLQVILVNSKSVRDANAAIENTFKANQTQLGNLPTLIGDTLVSKLFLTMSLPAYAVIDGEQSLVSLGLGNMFHPADIHQLVKDRAALLEYRRKHQAKGRVK